MSASSESTVGAVIVFLAGVAAGYVIKIVVDKYITQPVVEEVMADEDV